MAKQETTGAQRQKEIKALIATVKEQATQLQKVSAQVEMSKPAPQSSRRRSPVNRALTIRANLQSSLTKNENKI